MIRKIIRGGLTVLAAFLVFSALRQISPSLAFGIDVFAVAVIVHGVSEGEVAGAVLGATPAVVTGTATDPNLASVRVNGVPAALEADERGAKLRVHDPHERPRPHVGHPERGGCGADGTRALNRLEEIRLPRAEDDDVPSNEPQARQRILPGGMLVPDAGVFAYHGLWFL